MSHGEGDVAELPASPGARLRRAREARGMTPQQAAEQLTLDISVVTALEANDFVALGAPVFAKGHLRRYAALLELPGDDLLGGYERSNAQPGQPTLIPRSRTTMIPVRSRPKWPWVLGGMLAFMVAAAVAAYLSANGLHLPGDSDGASSESAPAATLGQLSGDGANSTSTATSPAATNPAPGAGATAGSSASGPSATTLPAGQVRLQLRFTADSWVEVYDATGKSVLYDLGRGGSERVVLAAAPLSVTIGNVRAASVSINGRPVVLPTPPAGQTVARFSIGANGAVR
jgi:cytoskeleton protein RodZ